MVHIEAVIDEVAGAEVPPCLVSGAASAGARYVMAIVVECVRLDKHGSTVDLQAVAVAPLATATVLMLPAAVVMDFVVVHIDLARVHGTNGCGREVIEFVVIDF